MAKAGRPLSWVVMHSVLIVAVLTSLLTGLRIAAVDRTWIQLFSALLPQGSLHQWHVISGILITAVTISFVVHLLLKLKKPARSSTSLRQHYHRVIIWLGYVLLLLIMLTGWLTHADVFTPAPTRQWHFYAAMAMLMYLFLHAGVYLVQAGWSVCKSIIRPGSQALKGNLMTLTVLLLISGVLGLIWLPTASHSLKVKHLPINTIIDIDGQAQEDIWNSAPEISVHTSGGANFVDGQTNIRVRAVENGVEVFMLVQWSDPTESLKHLPLKKTDLGWQVQQSGFQHFDEVEYYEDKLAIMLSDGCASGADGTSHLGPKPLADQPANWHGKGYHYVSDGRIRDLWHWKAVRTNDMYLADDNHIGPPDINRPGQRRYTAGYQQDGKESGAYVMNWQWYRADQVVPKRMPKDPALIEDLQTSKQHQDWVAPWFDYTPYEASLDIYPVGTLLPSVLYRSNRFEGDRADVRARGQWHNGVWTLELSRKLSTGSEHDVPLRDGSCLWLAAFDHSQVAHTRHQQAIRLNFEDSDE